MSTKDKYKIKVLEKALNVLKCFTAQRPEWRMTELCKELKMNRSTLYRILITLESQGFIAVSERNGNYKLGSAFVVLGATILNEMDLRKIASPYLQI